MRQLGLSRPPCSRSWGTTWQRPTWPKACWFSADHAAATRSTGLGPSASVARGCGKPARPRPSERANTRQPRSHLWEDPGNCGRENRGSRCCPCWNRRQRAQWSRINTLKMRGHSRRPLRTPGRKNRQWLTFSSNAGAHEESSRGIMSCLLTGAAAPMRVVCLHTSLAVDICPYCSLKKQEACRQDIA